VPPSTAGKQLGELGFWVAGGACEDFAQEGEGSDAEPLAGGAEAGQPCRRPSALVAIKEKPIFLTHGDPAPAGFGAVDDLLQVAQGLQGNRQGAAARGYEMRGHLRGSPQLRAEHEWLKQKKGRPLQPCPRVLSAVFRQAVIP